MACAGCARRKALLLATARKGQQLASRLVNRQRVALGKLRLRERLARVREQR